MNADDPRLTAYALGELEDAHERAAVEEALQNDPALQAEVNELRRLTGLLTETLQAEPVPEALKESEAAPEKVVPFLSWRRWQAASLALGGAAAAFVAAAVLLYQAAPNDPSLTGEALDGPVAAPQLREAPGRELLSPTPPATRSLAAEESALRGPVDEILERSDALEAERQRGAVASAVGVIEAEVPEFEEPALMETAPEMPELALRDSADVLGHVTEAFQGRSLNETPRRERSRNVADTAGDASLGDTVVVGIAGPAPRPLAQSADLFTTEAYDPLEAQPFRRVTEAPLSTFSIDVDTAALANVRRFILEQGELPPPGAVRIEELINAFTYDYAPPVDRVQPFQVHTEVTQAPWEPERQLVKVALKGYEIAWEERPPSNLVFLVDVSGSMDSPNKLPLAQAALQLLVDRLDGRDRVALVTYAGKASVALPSTTANNRATLRHAIEGLSAGGSTHGSEGIRTAYAIAREHFLEEGNNRVILVTDGDFNVGVTSRDALLELVEKEAEGGVGLSVFGFGMGNYNDSTLESLTNRGHGNYGYIDSIKEAERQFVGRAAGTLFTIARDVKIQVEFNPRQVAAYRLLGYENRALANEDFNDDTRDAGEIGAGHTVTALYEIIPTGGDVESVTAPPIDPLRYQATLAPATGLAARELLTVKLRYKAPGEEASELIERTVLAMDEVTPFAEASEDLRFASAVAGFGMLLRKHEHTGALSYGKVRQWVNQSLGGAHREERREFLELVRAAEQLAEEI